MSNPSEPAEPGESARDAGAAEARPAAPVLVPLGLSPAGETKLEVAQAHARATGAEIVLLHVLPEGALPADGAVAPAEAGARTYLDVIASRLRGGGTTAKPLLRSGPVAATVAAVAREQRAGLVVIGSDTRPRLARLLPGPGGHAGAITRAAPCPVLLVRPSTAAAVAPPVVRRFEDDAACAGAVEPRPLGYRTVDVARIVGVAGGLPDLGADFRPLRRGRDEAAHFRRTLRALVREALLPPVELRKLGYGYYVAKGHDQVAAAKHLGQLWLDAEVTEFVPIADDLARAASDARLSFERATGLKRVGAALPETYAGLEALIGAYGARERIADLRTAAARWYAAVFRPLQVRVRQRRLHQRFPGERTADVVLRVARFDETTGRRARTWESVLDDFAAAWRLDTAPSRAA